MTTILLFTFCGLAVIFSLLIIIVRNPIHSILYPIIVFCCVSLILIILGLEFSAIIFLIVYVGAIAVLFLFVVMMLNIKIMELDESFWRTISIGLVTASLFFLMIISIFPVESFSIQLGKTFTGCVRLESSVIGQVNKFLLEVLPQSSKSTFYGHWLFTYDSYCKSVNQIWVNDFPIAFLPQSLIFDHMVTESLASIGRSQPRCEFWLLNLLSTTDGYYSHKLLLANHVSLVDDASKCLGFSSNQDYFYPLIDPPLINYMGNWTFTNSSLLGWVIYTYTFEVFLIVSLLLLVAMIGSIVLVLNQNINVKRQIIFNQVAKTSAESISLKK